MNGKQTRREWYELQAAYWATKWGSYAFNPMETWFQPKMKECARLTAHFAILALDAED